jgi:hypothetical protein
MVTGALSNECPHADLILRGSASPRMTRARFLLLPRRVFPGASPHPACRRPIFSQTRYNRAMHAPNVLRKVALKQPAPRDSDAIPDRMCLRCGFPGPHVDAEDCIDALRDRLAMLEQRRENRRKREA